MHRAPEALVPCFAVLYHKRMAMGKALFLHYIGQHRVAGGYPIILPSWFLRQRIQSSLFLGATVLLLAHPLALSTLA